MTTLILTSKYQVNIPAEIRKFMKHQPGQSLQITEVSGKIEIRPILTANQLIGFLKDKHPLEFEREKCDRFPTSISISSASLALSAHLLS
jgi:AbrB family looped-hinge helix DNA binding protein